MRFEDFVLQLDTSSRGGFRARVLKSPFGEGAAGFSLPSLAGSGLSSHDVSGVSRDIGTQRTPASTQVLVPLDTGTELFRSVFQGQVGRLFDKSRGQLEVSPDFRLRLKIKIDPGDEETGALADLPWELLCDDETEDFFALSRQTSLVRYLDVPRSSQPISFTPPLRILAVSASPRGMSPLKVEEETERLKDLNRSSSGVEVELLSHASAGSLREALSEDSYNVLHFMGHGTFDHASGEGMLAFEGKDGSPDLVSGRAFATKLRDLRSLGVVVLNACDTARAQHQAGMSPFRGVATALVLGGVPAVVAMQRPISDRAALAFSAVFYRHLARGVSIDEALTEGRQAIHSVKPETFEWATPVLFLRIADGNVFVAKAAPVLNEAEPPVPAPAPALPQTASPVSPAVSSKSGPALKLAAGAAGASLLAFVLYTKLLAPSVDPPLPGGDSGKTSDFAEPTPGDTGTVPEPTPEEKRRSSGSNRGTKNEGDDRNSPASSPRDSAQRQSDPVVLLPTPEPADPQPSGAGTAPSAVTATAGASSLSAQVVKTERREEGGVRVTVSFTNTSDLPLSVTLDTESVTLSEYPSGGSYSALGGGERLDLAAKASSQRTFDFPIPKLGSQQLNLSLWAEEGGRIKVAGSRITLEGPS